jgi:hypothetical protein
LNKSNVNWFVELLAHNATLSHIGFAGAVPHLHRNFELSIDRNAPDFVRPAGFDSDPRLHAGFNSNLIRPYQGYAAITGFDTGVSSVRCVLSQIHADPVSGPYAILRGLQCPPAHSSMTTE